MKKILGVLIIVVILWVGNSIVFADPHGEPGTEILSQTITTTEWAGVSQD